MTSDQPPQNEKRTDGLGDAVDETKRPEAAIESSPKPHDSITVAATSPQPPPVKALTDEEQMALFAQELKENDWGHQPC